MPPLCTAGFSLANGEFSFFLGAIYLFIINALFICISTYVFVRYLKFPKVSFEDPDRQKRLDRWLMLAAVIVIVPSLFFAWYLQREASFKSRAKSFISHEIKFDRSFVAGHDIQYSLKDPKIVVSLLGEALTQNQLALVREKLKRYDLPSKSLEIRQSSIEDRIEKRLSEKIHTESTVSAEAAAKLSQLQVKLDEYKDADTLAHRLDGELIVLFPNILGVVFQFQSSTEVKNSSLISSVLVRWKSNPARHEQEKVTSFLKKRLEPYSGQGNHVKDL